MTSPTARVGLAVAIALTALALTRSTWFAPPAPGYIMAAQLARSGEFDRRAYDDEWYSAQVRALTRGAVSDVFTPNTPILPLALVPLAMPGDARLTLLWSAANAAALLLAAALVTSVCAPRGWSRPTLFVGVVMLALVSAPLRENFQRGQVYVFIWLLHAVAFWSLLRGDAVTGGVALGALMALKLNGWPMWILLAALKSWRALKWAAIAAVSLAAVSLPFVEVDVWRVFLTQALPGSWLTPIAAVPAYQTVNGFFQHLFRYDPVWNPSPVFDASWLAVTGSFGVTVALMAATLLRARCLPASRALGAGAALSVVLSAFAEQYHFLVMFVPLSAAASLQLDIRRAALFALAGVMLIVDLPFKSPALWNGATALLAYPRLYGALIVWGLLMFAPAPSTLEQGTT